jgi:hypothetical protein
LRSTPFLQQFENYRFKPALFAGEPKVILFDRSANFLVPLPRIDAKPREIRWTRSSHPGDTGIDNDGEPF